MILVCMLMDKSSVQLQMRIESKEYNLSFTGGAPYVKWRYICDIDRYK